MIYCVYEFELLFVVALSALSKCGVLFYDYSSHNISNPRLLVIK